MALIALIVLFLLLLFWKNQTFKVKALIIGGVLSIFLGEALSYLKIIGILVLIIGLVIITVSEL
ncbi:hypothetical protein ACFX5K_01150 [Rickettsiales bacterium LUAb2]